jgi:Protein of unknown function (DUF4011)
MPVTPNAANRSYSTADDGSFPDDSAVAEMVKQGIQKAREKLIDLTLRNGMLNYRHSETSSRHVRIINENPRLLVESLSSEQSIDVLPLPPVESIPQSYFMSGDGMLMPVRKNQPPPDLRYFKQSRK